MKFNFGDKVKDKTTDYVGTVVAIIEYDTSCIQYAVQTKKLKDGKPQHPEYIDEAHLELVTPKVKKKEEKPIRRTGGPSRNAPWVMRGRSCNHPNRLV